MKKHNVKKFVIIPTVLALGFATNSGALIAHASSAENTQMVEKISSGVQIDVLEGTEQNWTKLKVVSEDGIVEYVEKEILGDKVISKIYSDRYELTNEVVSEGEIITVNGEVVKDANGIVNTSMTTRNANSGVGTYAVPNDGDKFYLIKTINSSFQADFNTVAVCVSFLSVLFSVGGSWLTTAASAIIAAKIPTVWYTERTYSDKAQYRPIYEKYVTYYSNSARTKVLSVSDVRY